MGISGLNRRGSNLGRAAWVCYEVIIILFVVVMLVMLVVMIVVVILVVKLNLETR